MGSVDCRRFFVLGISSDVSDFIMQRPNDIPSPLLVDHLSDVMNCCLKHSGLYSPSNEFDTSPSANLRTIKRIFCCQTGCYFKG